MTKTGEIVKSCCQTVKVLINGTSTFGPALQLISQLFEMSTTRSRIDSRQSAPDLGGSGGAGERGLNWERDRAQK